MNVNKSREACLTLIALSMELDKVVDGQKDGSTKKKLNTLAIRSLQDENGPFIQKEAANRFQTAVDTVRSWFSSKKVKYYDLKSNLDYLQNLLEVASLNCLPTMNVDELTPGQRIRLSQVFNDHLHGSISRLILRIENIARATPLGQGKQVLLDGQLKEISELMLKMKSFPIVERSFANPLSSAKSVLKKEFVTEYYELYDHIESHLSSVQGGMRLQASKIEQLNHEVSAIFSEFESIEKVTGQEINDAKNNFPEDIYQEKLELLQTILDQHMVSLFSNRMNGVFTDLTYLLKNSIQEAKSFEEFCITRDRLTEQYCALLDIERTIKHKGLHEEFNLAVKEASREYQKTCLDRQSYFISKEVVPAVQKYFSEAIKEKDLARLFNLQIEAETYLMVLQSIMKNFQVKEGEQLSAKEQKLALAVAFLEQCLKNLKVKIQDLQKGHPLSSEQKIGSHLDQNVKFNTNPIVVTNSNNVTINVSNSSSGFSLLSEAAGSLLTQWGPSVLLSTASSVIFGGLPLGWALASGITFTAAPMLTRAVARQVLPKQIAPYIEPLVDFGTRLVLWRYGDAGFRMMRQMMQSGGQLASVPTVQSGPQSQSSVQPQKIPSVVQQPIQAQSVSQPQNAPADMPQVQKVQQEQIAFQQEAIQSHTWQQEPSQYLPSEPCMESASTCKLISEMARSIKVNSDASASGIHGQIASIS